jgi:D-alanine-D-alanine ligase
MARTIVGILRGGASSEYEHSLRSGAAILQALPEDRYDTRDIFVDRQGYWHSRGMPADPARAFSQVDVVFNALHGGAGEDGTIQRILDRAGIPYAGSRVIASNASFNKILARELLRRSGVRIPRGISFGLRDGTTGEMAAQAFTLMPPPYVVKPPMEGSSTGIVIAETIIELPDALGDVLDAYGKALVEEFVLGEEVSAGVIENFRSEPLYVLPPAHIVLPDSARYLHRDVLSEASHRYVVPSNFSHEQKRQIADMARAAHRALGMTHYSNIDMKLTRQGPVVLETNASPHLHEKSPFHHMLHSVGSSIRDFAEHTIALAQQR